MSGSNGNDLENKSTQDLEFQEFVRRQLELLFAQQTDMRTEMRERFLQLSRQIKDLDIKVDIYTREHSYMKDDIRELRAKMNLT
ncbi:MAG: hypothetical protein JST85_04980 [Acidobacteria bacterium]|nr:hypothetical protein [Acidobacteriota bacterium]